MATLSVEVELDDFSDEEITREYNQRRKTGELTPYTDFLVHVRQELVRFKDPEQAIFLIERELRRCGVSP